MSDDARVYVKYSPAEMTWANDANGLARWMVWEYIDERRLYGRGLAWCYDEATADVLIAALTGDYVTQDSFRAALDMATRGLRA